MSSCVIAVMAGQKNGAVIAMGMGAAQNEYVELMMRTAGVEQDPCAHLSW